MSILSLLLATSIVHAPTAASVPTSQGPAGAPKPTNDAVSVMARVLGITVDPARVGKPLRIDALAQNVGEAAWFRLLAVSLIDIGKHRGASMEPNGKVRLHLAIEAGYHYVVHCEVALLEDRKTKTESDWMNAGHQQLFETEAVLADPGRLITTVVTPREDAVNFSLTIDPLEDARHGSFWFEGCSITPIAP